MKKIILFLLYLTSNTIFSQFTLIPDTSFEQKLINLNIDSDNTINGHVLTSDIASVTFLSLASSPAIFDLTGIEDFLSLESLALTECKYLNTINLQANVNLKVLKMDFTTQTHTFTYPIINLSNNILLEELVIGAAEYLTIDLSNNINLQAFALETSTLNYLDFSYNTNLKYLYINNSLISNGINVNNNSALEGLDLFNDNLYDVDLSTNVNLKYLFLSRNNLQSINLENNILLEQVYVGLNNLSALYLNFNTQLKVLNCSYNQINTLNLNINSSLNILDVSNNALQNLTIKNGNNSALTGTYINNPFSNSYNRFSAINNPNLRCIYVDDVNYSNTNWLLKDATSTFVSTVAECNLLTTNEFASVSKFKLYPNPSKDIIHIDTNDNLVKTEIYNLVGQLVLESSSKELNITKLNAGTYIAKIFTDDKVEIAKFLKN